jgi:hypothetical protein
MSTRSTIWVVLGALLVSSVMQAQGTPAKQPPVGARARANQLQRGRNAAQQMNPAQRVALEREVRQALARAVRRQLALKPAEMTQLATVDQKFELQRRALAQRARQTRLSLRAAMEDSSAAAQSTIAQHLDTLLVLERQRIDLLEAEQKELATFLTPLQRAKYQALQERVRRRLEELRVGGAGATDSALGIRPQRPRR